MDTAQAKPSLGNAIALAERRDMLSRMRPRCPYCGSEQVQLLDRFSRWPAEWRCRKDRRHRFVADTLISERAVNGAPLSAEGAVTNPIPSSEKGG